MPERTLPVFERIAPTPPLALLADRIEAYTRPGEVVLDVASRGAWTARAAVDRDRRAVVIESDPLTRLLAEIVLRPPDLRHLDAAFQAIAAAPRRQSSLKRSIEETYATRCPHCGRTSAADEFVWEGPPATARLIRKHYRCLTCRQGTGTDLRHEPTDEADAERAIAATLLDPAVRARLRGRFSVPGSIRDSTLPDELLGLHTERQLAGLAAIVERIETDLRAPEVEAALRLALLHAIPPCTRLNAYPGRPVSLRIVGGHLRQPTSAQWRERNPWLAFEEGMRLVRGFVGLVESGSLFSAPTVEVAPAVVTVESGLPAGAEPTDEAVASHPVTAPTTGATGGTGGLRSGPVHPRFGGDIRSLADQAADVVVRLATPYGLDALAEEAASLQRLPEQSRIRLFIGEVPRRANTERLSLGYVGTCWALGRDAASFLPLEPLFGPSPRIPWGSHAALVARNLAAATPLMAPEGRALLLVDVGGAEGLVAAALGGVAAGYRVLRAELHAPDEGSPSLLELVPPGGLVPGGPRTRANVPLPALPGGAGDPDVVPSGRIFGAPVSTAGRRFSPAEVGRTVTEAVVRALQARGEPADFETLLGGVLVELDRTGQLRRLVEEMPVRLGRPPATSTTAASPAAGATGAATPPETGLEPEPHDEPPAHLPADPVDAADAVARLLAAIRGELERADHRRLEVVAPGTWWLADRDDRAAAEAPLADRLEWSVFSLLSTSGALPEAVVRDRAARLVGGLSEGDAPLLDACLASYRSRSSSPDRVATDEELGRRSNEHAEVVGLLADLGHRLGMSVAIGEREASRPVRGRPLAERLTPAEREASLASLLRAPAEVAAEIDCAWYVRSRGTFLFEVEWTGIVSEALLRRGSRIPNVERLVRFLVLAPERAELVRLKLARSPLLRTAMERDNWHILTWENLGAFASRERPDLDDLEPYLGLGAPDAGDQLALFD